MHVAFGATLRARFVDRHRRFLVHARLGARGPGRLVRVACRDPGRLEGLLRPGVELLLRAARPGGAARRTGYDLLACRAGRSWVCLVPALANDVLAAALARGELPGWRGARVLRREVRHAASRFDMLVARRGRRVWVEVKAATWLQGRWALFPDAPTERGARHVAELAALARAAQRAALVFVVQRPGARACALSRERDPAFARAVERAARAGVERQAFACLVGPRGVRLVRRLQFLGAR